MKKNVLVFGLIAGFIASALMGTSMAIYYKEENCHGSMLLGYTFMIVAFSFIYVGVRNYRNKYLGGEIRFGKAFLTGLYIALIASTMYVATWAVEYHFFLPDFMDKYAASMVAQVKAAGADQATLDKTASQMTMYSNMYKNPVSFALLTYMEILPVGVIIALISALLLKTRKKTPTPALAAR